MEELVGIPQRQLGVKVDKEQERKGLEKVEEGDSLGGDGKAKVPHTPTCR